MKELIDIQQKLVAKKSQFNSFGKYYYRSCEDILQAVKPILQETNTYLLLNDEVVELGGRFYIKATATLYTADGKNSVSTTAFAREPESKTGADQSQISGSSSSYARKYALNGLFCIDDNKDADFTNTHGKKAAPAPAPVDEAALQQAIDDLMCTSTDRASFVAAWKRHPQFHKVEAFMNAAAKLSIKYPKA